MKIYVYVYIFIGTCLMFVDVLRYFHQDVFRFYVPMEKPVAVNEKQRLYELV